jgi:Ca-activated chloride channel homolog
MFRWAGMQISAFDVVDVTIPGWVFLLVGALVILTFSIFYGRMSRFTTSSLRYSDIRMIKRVGAPGRGRYRVMLPILRMLAVALLFIAMARPQSGSQERELSTEGIDIVMVLDISGSMKAEDFQPNNRLFVAKEEIETFISKRVSDRIGLVVFARTAFTQCPLTLDYDVLKSFLRQVDFGIIDDGTAIGTALATAVNRLKDSEAKSKVIILLTDGVNNSGEIDPLTAANIARTFDMKVYTIGVGRPGNSHYTVDDPIFGKRVVYMANEIDEESLTQIAEATGGKYFRARSKGELGAIYEDIDKLEKTEIKVKQYVNYKELFPRFLIFGLILLFAEAALSQTVLRKVP